MDKVKLEKTNKTILVEMFRALLPAQILSSAVASLGSIINGIVIGNYLPASALTALGFVNPLTAIIAAIGAVFAGGSRILCGRYIGRGDSKNVDATFSNTIFLAFVVGVAISLGLMACSVPVAGLLGATKESLSSTSSYIQGLSIGTIPTLLVPAFMIFLQMSGEANYAFLASIVLVVANLFAAIVDVKVFNSSVFGMGLAVSISQYAALLFMVIRFLVKKDLMHFDLKFIEGKLCKGIFFLGSPTAAAAFLYSLRNLVLNYFALKRFGEIAIDVMAIANSAVGPFDAVNIGVGAVALALSSMFVGEKNEDSLEELFSHTLKTGFILCAVKLGIIVLFGNQIAILFGAHGVRVGLTASLLLAMGLNMPINIVTLALVNPYQSCGRVGFVNILYIFSAFVFPVAFAFGACYIIGYFGIWYCYLAAECLTLILIAVVASKKAGHFPKTKKQWLMLNGKEEGSKYTKSITSMDEVINMSKEIIEFCLANGIDEKKSYISGLCVEEMAGNVVEHGFNKKKKRVYVVDAFVCCEDGKVSIRLRNNTPAFDPRTKLTAFDPEDPAKNMGIRMVAKLAKEMNYQTTFGMNVVSIEL